MRSLCVYRVRRWCKRSQSAWKRETGPTFVPQAWHYLFIFLTIPAGALPGREGKSRCASERPEGSASSARSTHVKFHGAPARRISALHIASLSRSVSSNRWSEFSTWWTKRELLLTPRELQMAPGSQTGEYASIPNLNNSFNLKYWLCLFSFSHPFSVTDYPALKVIDGLEPFTAHMAFTPWTQVYCRATDKFECFF